MVARKSKTTSLVLCYSLFWRAQQYKITKKHLYRLPEPYGSVKQTRLVKKGYNMTVWIEWSTVYRMFQISIMLGSEVSNFYLPLHEMKSMKFLFKQLTIRSLHLGSTITDEQNDALREALK